MKIFRDKTHSVITFNYHHQGQSQLAITIMTMFSFAKKEEFLSYAEFWRVAKKNFDSNQGDFIDLYMPKKRAEFFVKGSCYSYDGTTSQSMVKVTLDGMQKQLNVYGDRVWSEVGSGYQLSRPSCFSNIPITLNKAYGGKTHAINPDGQGFTASGIFSELKVPNIELPTQLMRQPTDVPPPALLLPHSPTCKYQLDKLGTFDNDWLLNESPYYPADINWLYFNLAESDQQREHYFNGDEGFSCTNMHPVKPIIQGQLPGIRVRCFFKRVTSTESLNELALNLDTVWLLPEEEKGILIWHGLIDTQDISAKDIDFIYSVSEPLAETKKDLTYYIKMRTPPENKVEESRKKEEAIKAEAAFKTKAGTETNTGTKINIDTMFHDIVKSFHPTQDPEQLEAQKQFKGKTPEETLLDVAKHYEKHNQAMPSPSGLNVLANESYPPKNTPPNHLPQLDFLKEQIINGSHSESEKSTKLNKLDQLKQKLDQLDQESRRYQFRKRAAEPSKFSREDILNGYQQGKHFANENLAGLDLSDLDLSGINLSGCNLSECNLSRTRLNHADLSTATFIHTNLSETLLEQANLSNALIKNSSLNQTDFKECHAHYVVFDGCSGSQCNFSKTFLNYAQIKNCQLIESVFMALKANFLNISESTFDSCNFSDARLQFATVLHGSWSNINWAKADLSHTRFDSTRLSVITGNNLVAPNLSLNQCILDHLTVSDSNFDRLSCKGANLADCTFNNCSLPGLNLLNANVTESKFIKCRIIKLRGNEQTNISATHFESCNLSNLALLGGHYKQITINHSEMEASQIINCTWSQSIFSQCNAKKLRFVTCKIDSCLFQDINFFQGIFYGTAFKNNEFNHCNLYSIPFTNCLRENEKIIDCLTKNIALNQEETS
ncbi:DUF2169 family type VI secretion system accessory protein [Legionella maioricensis]|uniref:DUF2169 domain-containing protein n=1 Tax=Legionella maioricensis TaxID=2896528 RepID=A0A9X2D1I5_9GAMM|nr:DUF2169 domain-containing protein [Legionella maioricensis]MCL9684910.1 DUF2169 domain-containing protein [Legionella maioricensis]MCL9688258.1 DUF2169 domain-containing protein [Legionella maioricensis]